MARRISRDADDREAGLTFHNSPTRLNLDGMSFVAMQRFFDQVDRSIYLCQGCGWRGRGRELAAMEQDSRDTYAFDTASDSWYACPRCEQEISLSDPIMRLVPSNARAPESTEAIASEVAPAGSA